MKNDNTAKLDDNTLSQVTGGSEMWNSTREEHYAFIYNMRVEKGIIDSSTISFDNWLTEYIGVPDAITARNSWLKEPNKMNNSHFIGVNGQIRIVDN